MKTVTGKSQEDGSNFESRKDSSLRIYRLIDSVKNLDDDILYNFFQFGDFLVSTTSQYIAIDLINDDMKVLTINTRFSEPNAFYMPWKLRLNGYEYSSAGMQINQFIRKVYPALSKDESKSNTLHKMISYLYFSTDIAK